MIDHWMGRLLGHIRKSPTEIISIGTVATWFRGGYSLEGVEKLLDGLVVEGILRIASEEELRRCGQGKGYFLADGAFAKLPMLEV